MKKFKHKECLINHRLYGAPPKCPCANCAHNRRVIEEFNSVIDLAELAKKAEKIRSWPELKALWDRLS